MDYEHNKLCISAQEKYTKEKSEFEATHPNYCQKCRGWGFVGSGLMDRDTGMTDSEPCPFCLDEGKCPHCGESIEEPFNHCSHCGWDLETSNGIIEPPECWCWEDAADKIMKTIKDLII